ncbi:hypothetical protein F4801DRAFT_595183 [Xylaria longipes]|nr:hypothetical protein F4801DRAFT_595183 [Xylaria longipes]RYC65886.1 hypothetical protein CHU98_g292 [Xylaria longipes]
MEPSDQGSVVNNTADRKEKNGRTPLKQPVMSQPIAPPATALRRTRKRTGGKRTVKSCTSCRAAHVRCVADRYGVPCERCAKKSWSDCSLMHKQPEQTPTKSESTDQSEALSSSPEADVLKQIASDTLALMAEGVKTVSP